MSMSGPFEVGTKVFIRTVTYHWVGQVESVGDGYVHLTDASWVADSGRFSTAIEKGTLSEVERVGEAAVAVQSIVDVIPWRHKLPTATK